jgi:hypothetical protein
MFFISPMAINVLGFKINSIDNGAVANMGLGQNMGDGSNFLGTRSFVDDRDQLDSNSTFETTAKVPIP